MNEYRRFESACRQYRWQEDRYKHCCSWQYWEASGGIELQLSTLVVGGVFVDRVVDSLPVVIGVEIIE
jgi:hypothetical protein